VDKQLWSLPNGSASWKGVLGDIVSVFSDDNGDMYAGQSGFLPEINCIVKRVIAAPEMLLLRFLQA